MKRFVQDSPATLSTEAPRDHPRALSREALGEILLPLLALGAILTVWEMVVRLWAVPTYLVPAPSLVLQRLVGALPLFAFEGVVTLLKALAGLAVGSGAAVALGLLMASSRFLERVLFPLAILAKVTPIIAVAPLLILWFGFTPLPEVLIVALMVFFPVLVNAITGFRAVDPVALDFLRSLYASSREIFQKLRVPSSLPYLFAALRIGQALALIGAVVAEWLGADRGLGRVILLANNNLDMPTLFAGIVVLAALGIGLNSLLTLLERRLLFWHPASLSLS